MNETQIELIFWLIWLGMATTAIVCVVRYFRQKKSGLGFWQFTFKQLWMLVTFWTVLVWLIYLWCLDRFGP